MASAAYRSYMTSRSVSTGGPGRAGTVTTQARNRPHLRALALLGRDEPPAEGYDPGRLHQTLGELWCSGVAIDLVGEVKPTRPAPKLPL